MSFHPLGAECPRCHGEGEVTYNPTSDPQNETSGRCDLCHGTGRLECIDGPEGCQGAVALRWPGYGEQNWPRCEKHGRDRLEREEQAIKRHGNPDSPCPPRGFDPLDAGESWEAA